MRELGFNKECASEHICRYYGAFEDPSTATISIAMELCEGGSLDSIYKEVKRLGGRTGEKVLGKIAEGVLRGLTYLHTQRIMHRDIKPSNILLCRDGAVKLCDFGVSGDFGTKGEANTFIGTSYYMAPERITGQSYTITSDVWSTGVTLLEVAQHRFPFPADGTEMQPRAGLIDLLTYIVRQPVPQLKDEPDVNVYWSENFKYFIECWSVLSIFASSPALKPPCCISLTFRFAALRSRRTGEPAPGKCWITRGWWRWWRSGSTWSNTSPLCGAGTPTRMPRRRSLPLDTRTHDMSSA